MEEEKKDTPVESHEPSTSSESHPSSNGWYKATFLRRLGAALIDGVILIVINILITLLLPESLRTWTWLLGMLYGVLFIWKKGATPGKSAMGIKVVTKNGENLSLLQAILRETVGKFLSGLLFCLGYIWMLWDQNSQTWHDKIAGTYVVTKIPNKGNKASGCLIAFAIGVVALIPIIAIISAVVVMVINPLELTRRSRDAFRMTHAVQLQSAINVAVQNANENQETPFSLCVGTPEGMPCMGRSDRDTQMSDGTGWVKVDLRNGPVPVAILEKDPVNSDEIHFTYCSDGTDWEINFKLESEQQMPKMTQDNGDDPELYELGSNLMICR